MQIRSVVTAALLFLVSACAQTGGARQAQEFLPDGGPPVVNGFYEERLTWTCPGEGCADMAARALVDLRGGPGPDAAVVAKLVTHEWVSRVGALYRMRPIRGVVRQASERYAEGGDGRVLRLEPGDVVYMIDTRLEIEDDNPTVWFRGERFVHYLEEGDVDPISWDFPSQAQSDADEAAGTGEWIEVRRDNSQIGFVARWDLEWDLGWGGRTAHPNRLDCPAHDISISCQDLRSIAEPVAASYPTPRPFRDCAACPSMVWIPEQSFAAGQYEVTFAEWDACVAGGGCAGSSPYDQGWGRGDHPVMGVRWADAQAYVQWLSQHTRQLYRLLTTDEWTAAAFPGGRRQHFSWGNEWPVCDLGVRNGAAYNACMPQRTMPVGSFQPNAYGLYDTIGNVGEWLQDPYEPGDGRHAIIGSSWASDLGTLGGRGGGWDHDLGPDTGFRVARER